MLSSYNNNNWKILTYSLQNAATIYVEEIIAGEFIKICDLSCCVVF